MIKFAIFVANLQHNITMRQGITLSPSKVNQELSSFGLEIIPKKLQKLVFVCLPYCL